MSTKVISGILLKAGDNQEPMPVPVTDYVSLQEYVGGHFDVVTETYKAEEFLLESDAEFVCVGYCHDEGLLLDLPLNKLATLLFRRELRGDVVVVSGTSPSGEYDGNNYELPSWFSDEVFSGLLAEAVTQVDEQTSLVVEAIQLAQADGLIDDKMVAVIGYLTFKASTGDISDEHLETLNGVMEMVTMYYMARLKGMPKFTKEQVLEALGMDESDDPLPSSWDLTDEQLAKFLSENGGN